MSTSNQWFNENPSDTLMRYWTQMNDYLKNLKNDPKSDPEHIKFYEAESLKMQQAIEILTEKGL